MRVIHGSAEPRRRSAIQAAYDEFRLDRQGELVSPRTLEYYDDRIGQFLAWLAEERPEVRRMQDLDVGVVREYRAYVSGRVTRSGRPIRPKTVAESHTALMAELDEERTLRLMQGCLSSLGALHGWFDFEEAWEGSRPLVAAQFEERGRPFSRMAREKASRRLRVTVIEGGAEQLGAAEEEAA